MAEDTRQLIITEAKRLFYQYGFRRITTDEIASNLRISKKTLYALFPSKKELIRATVLDIMTPRLEQMQILLASSRSVADLLTDIIENIHLLGREISEPMMIDMRAMPELWREIEERRMTVLSHIGEVVERGQKRGEIRPDLNVNLFLAIFMQAISRIATPAVMLEHNLKPSELVAQLFDIFFHGIVSIKRRSKGKK